MKVFKIKSILAIFLIFISGCRSTKWELIDYKNINVFQAWTGVENLESLNYWEQLAKHSLIFSDVYQLNHASWDPENGEPQYRGLITSLNKSSLVGARLNNDKLKSFNPDIKLIVNLAYREGFYKTLKNEGEIWWEKGYFPPDSPYWLQDKDGNYIVGWGEDTNLNSVIDTQDAVLSYLIDFTNPEVQELISLQAKSIFDSGLFDGVFFDWMSEGSTTDDVTIAGWEPVLTKEEELAARISLIQKVRKNTSDDFIIMGNTNFSKNEVLAPLLNAVFMECFKNPYYESYSLEELIKIQDAVIFNQKNLAPPALVCLEGWRLCTEYNGGLKTRITERNTNESLQMMRFFTTMSLTLTNGYVLFSDDNALPHWDHAHNWYDFWDAPLGNPVSEYQQLYKNIKDLYIREFENGWAVYNFSGEDRLIEFSDTVKSVATDQFGEDFIVSNIDGDIFLK